MERIKIIGDNVEVDGIVAAKIVIGNTTQRGLLEETILGAPEDALKEEYDRGYSDGEDAGYDNGYEVGCEAGKADAEAEAEEKK